MHEKSIEHIQSISNPILFQLILHKRNQKDGDTIQYVTTLMLLALGYDFGDSSDEMMIDKLVFDVQSGWIRERLSK